MIRLARKFALATNVSQQVYFTESYDGVIYDFEAVNSTRENVVKKCMNA